MQREKVLTITRNRKMGDNAFDVKATWTLGKLFALRQALREYSKKSIVAKDMLAELERNEIPENISITRTYAPFINNP